MGHNLTIDNIDLVRFENDWGIYTLDTDGTVMYGLHFVSWKFAQTTYGKDTIHLFGRDGRYIGSIY